MNLTTKKSKAKSKKVRAPASTYCANEIFLTTLSHATAKGPFRSSSQAATCYYQSNHLKVEAFPLSA